MSHLKILAVQNYQSHKNSELHLHEGVNVLIGSSDNGKSVILRAIKWLCTNTPKGEAYRSTWGGRTLVEGEFSDSLVVGRQKDKESKDNIYYINDADYKIEQSGAVPDEVVAALNISDINIQSQLDPIFFLQGISSGERAKMLNQVANLSIIDTAVANIKSKVTENRREIKTVESQIAELEKQQDSFKYLEQMERGVTAYEEIGRLIGLCDAAVASLDILLIRLGQDQQELQELNLFLQAEPSLEAALTLIEEEKAATGQINSLFAVFKKVEQAGSELQGFRDILELEKDVEIALQTVTNLHNVTKEGQALLNLIADTDKKHSSLNRLVGDILIKQTEYTKSMPEVCPLCEK